MAVFARTRAQTTRSDGEGGRVYTCRDPEGHIWSFGTYDPWRADGGEAVAGQTAVRRRRFSLRDALLLPVATIAVATAAWMYLEAEQMRQKLDTLATLQVPPTPTAEKDQLPRERSARR